MGIISRPLRYIALIALAAGALLIAGCVSTPKAAMPTPTQSWSTESGQLQYRSRTGKSVIGDVVVRRAGPSDYLLIFTSGPGVPLLKLQVHGSNVSAEGLFARGRWSGEIGSAPAHLRGWVKLPELFAQFRTSKTAKAGSMTATIVYSGANPQHVEVASPETGERFVFHFSR